MTRRQLKNSHQPADLKLFAGMSEPVHEVLKFWRATKQDEFFFEGGDRNMFFDMQDHEEQNEGSASASAGPTGLMYLRYLVHLKNLQPYMFEGISFHSVLDVFALRNRLYNIKDIESVNFRTLLGIHIKEVKFTDKKSQLGLVFSSNIDSGNLLRVTKSEQILLDEYGLEQEVYEVESSPDTNTLVDEAPDLSWFHFKVKGGKKDRIAIFRVLSMSNPNFLNVSVCFKSKQLEGKSWQRLSPKDCRYFPLTNPPEDVQISDASRARCLGNHCLEFRYQFTSDQEEVTFAPEFPYSYEDLQKDSVKWMNKLRDKKGL